MERVILAFGCTKVTSHLASQKLLERVVIVRSVFTAGRDVKYVIRPSKLKSHRDKNHPQKKDDDINALSAKRVRYDLETTLFHLGFTVEQTPILQCSCKVAYQIAKCKKLYTIAEEVIQSCAENFVKIMIGSGAKKKIQQVLFSNDNIRRRIDDMPLMCATKFAPKSIKARSRLAFNWTSLPIPL